jgi:hypothetical protein
MFGSANVEKVEQFKMNFGKVDFGDHPHLGGQAQGDAIICWSIDGRAAVKGVLFSDNFQDSQKVTIEIRFRRETGQVTNLTKRSVRTNGGVVGVRDVEKVSPSGSMNEVRIRLKLFIADTGLGPVNSIVTTQTFRR